VRRITYSELHADVNKFANVLKGLGVARGDRVAIYLPMVPRSGRDARLRAHRAVHTLFGGFSVNRCATGSTMPARAGDHRDGGYRRAPSCPENRTSMKRSRDASIEHVIVCVAPGKPSRSRPDAIC